MSLTAREIRTGSIAYFDDKLLLAETEVKHGEVNRAGSASLNSQAHFDKWILCEGQAALGKDSDWK